MPAIQEMTAITCSALIHSYIAKSRCHPLRTWDGYISAKPVSSKLINLGFLGFEESWTLIGLTQCRAAIAKHLFTSLNIPGRSAVGPDNATCVRGLTRSVVSICRDKSTYSHYHCDQAFYLSFRTVL